MSLSYTPGTRYTNPHTYDRATEEVVHGFQVFVQVSGGKPTGRKAFVDTNGTLVSVELAERRRDEIIEANAQKLLWALDALVDQSNYAALDAALDAARKLLREVKGDTAPEHATTSLAAAPLKSNYEAALDTVNALEIDGVARIVGLSQDDETKLIETIGGVAPWGRFAVEFGSTAHSATNPSVRYMKIARKA